MVSAIDRAKRALVALLKRLAAAYLVELSLTRDLPTLPCAQATASCLARATQITEASHRDRVDQGLELELCEPRRGRAKEEWHTDASRKEWSPMTRWT